MSVQTHPTPPPAHHTPEPTHGTTGPPRPGASSPPPSAAGAVAALVLALVVFPGGTEATITGGPAARVRVRLGADGHSDRSPHDRQPQRWAAVPAVAMGATGAALVVFTPDNQTMTALNWVWPPLMLALAVGCSSRCAAR